MLKTAVILAAGLGSRLNNITKSKPKGFLNIEGTSLIKRSIDNLLSVGIQKIYIGTGYLSEAYDEFAQEYPQIETIKSKKYETTGSMYTLYNMKNKLEDDFLLLESDLLYERDVLKQLLYDSLKDIILGSGETKSNDEVFIQTDKNSNLINLSKNQNELESLDAELVGISKISKEKICLNEETF